MTTVRFLPGLALLPFLTAHTHAQSTSRVVPKANASVEGLALGSDPFVESAAGYRYQQVFAARNLARAVMTLNAVAYRADRTLPFPLAATTIAGVTVKLGKASVSPNTIELDFAANRSGAMTKVFEGQVSLPAVSLTAPSPQPFNIVLPFRTPYVHVVTSDMLLEVEVAPTSTRNFSYFLDVEADRGNPGRYTTFGKQGTFQSQEQLTFNSSAGVLVPGGRVDYLYYNMKSRYPTIASFGFSKSRFGAIALPFDLAALGAPGSSLYSSIDLAFAAELASAAPLPGFLARVALDIPNDPKLGGLQLYSQLFFIDPKSNAFGIVTSPGLDIVLGTNPVRETQAIRAPSLTATRGDYLFRSNIGVGGYTVTELRGSFR